MEMNILQSRKPGGWAAERLDSQRPSPVFIKGLKAFRNRRHGFTLRLCLFFLVALSAPAAMASLGIETADTFRNERPAAVLDFNDIWFYDEQMNKRIPHVDPNWIMVVFSDHIAPIVPGSSPKAYKESIDRAAKELMTGRNELLDWFYDPSLLDTGCFFSLGKGMSLKEIAFLINELNQLSLIRYSHPVLRIKDRAYIFQDILDIEWKTGVSADIKQRILDQAKVSADSPSNTYRVNIFEIPFFTALNLLAEDIHVVKASPRLAAFTPTIRTALTFRIHGGNIGDMLPFVFTVQFSDRFQIDASSIANLDLRPAGIQKELYELSIEPYDYVLAASRSPIRITGWLKLFTPGDAVIAPVKIKYTCLPCADNQVQTIETDPVALRISAIVPPTAVENDLIVPTDIPVTFEDIRGVQKTGRKFLLLSLTAFLIALIASGWFIKILFDRSAQQKRSAIRSDRDTLKDTLTELLGKTPPTPHWAYVADLGRLLRKYLVLTYPLPACGTGGGAEVFFRAIHAALPAEPAPRVQQVLKTIDDVVAAETADCPNIEAIKTGIWNVIDTAEK